MLLTMIFAVSCNMYNDYSKKSRTTKVPGTLKEIVQMQIIFREDPNGGRENDSFASSLEQIGFKTTLQTFASTPEGCKNSPSTQYNTFACDEFYAYTTINASRGIICNSNGVGNFAAAFAIDKNKVPEDWLCACMDHQFNMQHGNCQ